MRKIFLPIAGIVMLSFLLMALSASAQTVGPGVSFGGRIISVVPCLYRGVPAEQVRIIRAGGWIASTYIWSSVTTITKLAGPPILGGQVLGLAGFFVDACTIPGTGLFGVPIPLFGFPMFYIGTSPSAPPPGASAFFI